METHGLSALQNYAQARPATKPAANTPEVSAPFEQAFSNFTQTLQRGEQAAVGAMTGDSDPHALVQALVQTELAVETAVTVRNKVVEAYQEIMRMPV
jgi:flagellar hook-basal body complex protein FliE